MGLLVAVILIVLAIAVVVAFVKLVLGLLVLIAGAVAVWWAYRKLTGPTTTDRVIAGTDSSSRGSQLGPHRLDSH